VAFVVFVVLVGYAFFSYTQEGREIKERIMAYSVYIFLLVFFLIAVYFAWKNQVKDEWAEAWEVLRMACEGREGGFRNYGFKYRELMMIEPPIYPIRIEPHMAYIWVGQFWGNGKTYSFMFDGKRPASGRIYQAWSYELRPQEIKELQRSGVSLEEAYAKIREIRQLDEAANKEE
jgi:hypothetical protein